MLNKLEPIDNGWFVFFGILVGGALISALFYGFVKTGNYGLTTLPSFAEGASYLIWIYVLYRFVILGYKLWKHKKPTWFEYFVLILMAASVLYAVYAFLFS